MYQFIFMSPWCVCKSIQRSILGNFLKPTNLVNGLKVCTTDCFSSEAWVTAVDKFGLDGGHVQLLTVGNLIQVSVPILKTQFRSISEMRTLMELHIENILTLVEYFYSLIW